MSRVNDLTIEGIIKKYENRQQKLRTDCSKENDFQETARAREGTIASGVSTPEFSNTINRREITKKMEDAEQHIQRTHKKQDHIRMRQQEAISFSTDRIDLESVLRQLEQTEERLARSERNYAEVSRKCEQLQREGREVQLEGRVRQHETGELEGRLAALERENINYRECLATKESNIEILRQKLKEKNQKLIDSERANTELKSQLAAITAQGQKWKEQQQIRQREKEQLISRLRSELSTLQNVTGQRDAEKRQLLQEIERSYRAHQQELEVVKKSYLQVEEEYKQWIEDCNTQKLALITEYEKKLTEARAATQNISTLKTQQIFQEQLSKRERQSARLIALTAKQANDLKFFRSELQGAEKAKNELILKVSSLENALIDKAQMLSSLDQAYNKLVEQQRHEEDRTRQWREKYNSVNRQFVELRSKCSVLFESLEESKRESQGQGAELVRIRKELLLCREQLQRSRSNEMALGVKLADATRTVKERLQRLEQQREESLTDLLAERLQTARLQEELQETRLHLKREYDLSVENTRKELERQINANNRTSRSNDPSKDQLYLQLRALERKYELLANQIVTVDEVMDIATKVKRRHEPLKKSRLQS